MAKLHEVLAAEETVVSAAEKLVGETTGKFEKFSEFFVGNLRTLKRLGDTLEDKAEEEAARKDKVLTTTVHETVEYTFDFIKKQLDVKLRKHLTNQVAKADIVIDNVKLMSDVPVDFLLDMEKFLPRWRAMFLKMPTLDPSKAWTEEREHVYKTQSHATQTEKHLVPIIMAPATDKHAAQVKEGSETKVVGTYTDVTLSGQATTQQKADMLETIDNLIVAVKSARMRANSVEVVAPTSTADGIMELLMLQLSK